MSENFETKRTNELPILQLERKPIFAATVSVALAKGASPQEVVDCLLYVSKKENYRDQLPKEALIDAEQLQERMDEFSQSQEVTYSQHLAETAGQNSTRKLVEKLRSEVERALFLKKPLLETWKYSPLTAPLLRRGLTEYVKEKKDFDPDIVFDMLKVLVPDHDDLAVPENREVFREQINELRPPTYGTIIAELDRAWGVQPVDKLEYTSEQIFSLTEKARADRAAFENAEDDRAHTGETGNDE